MSFLPIILTSVVFFLANYLLVLKKVVGRKKANRGGLLFYLQKYRNNLMMVKFRRHKASA
jgi:hypothetical protein